MVGESVAVVRWQASGAIQLWEVERSSKIGAEAVAVGCMLWDVGWHSSWVRKIAACLPRSRMGTQCAATRGGGSGYACAGCAWATLLGRHQGSAR